MTKNLNSWLVALLSAAALAAAPAGAADNPRDPKPKAAPLLLTPAQLRECLSQKDRLHSGNEQSVREQAELAQNKAEIERLGVALKEQLASLDRTSADAVAAYNARAESRDKMMDTYQEALPAFNARVESLKTERASYAKSCENKRYDEADEMSIRKGR